MTIKNTATTAWGMTLAPRPLSMMEQMMMAAKMNIMASVPWAACLRLFRSKRMPKVANMVASAVYSTVSTTKMTTVAVEASTSRLPDVNASTMVTMVIVKSTAVAPPATRHSTPNTFTAKGRRLRSIASRSAR